MIIYLAVSIAILFLFLASVSSYYLRKFLILLRLEQVKNIQLSSQISFLRSVEQQVYTLNNELEKKNFEIRSLTAIKIELEVTLQKERMMKEQEIKLLQNTEERLIHSFKSLSNEMLRSNNKIFLETAEQALEKKMLESSNYIEKKHMAIKDLVNPIQEKLEKFDHEIKNLEKIRLTAFDNLNHQISNLITETSTLSRAFRVPNIRGRWGELQLERAVEIAGMTEYCDFVKQCNINDDENNVRLRPDMIIKMPSNRQIIVDAKVPLDAYLEAVAQSNASLQELQFKRHAMQVKQHLSDLSKKEYWSQFQNTPEFVVLFLPSESIFSIALEYEPILIETGAEKKVLIATPTTLIALLKTVAYGWKQEVIAENTKKISALGNELYDRLCTMGKNFESLGTSLKNSVENYNKTLASLESRVFVSARKFNSLGISTQDKVLPSMRSLAEITRDINIVEYQED